MQTGHCPVKVLQREEFSNFRLSEERCISKRGGLGLLAPLSHDLSSGVRGGGKQTIAMQTSPESAETVLLARQEKAPSILRCENIRSLRACSPRTRGEEAGQEGHSSHHR